MENSCTTDEYVRTISASYWSDYGARRWNVEQTTMRRLVTVKEIAEMLSVRESWVYAKVASGDIPHTKVGRYVRFNPDRVMAWLAAESRAERAARPQ